MWARIIYGSKQPSLKFKLVQGNISVGNYLISKIGFLGLGSYYYYCYYDFLLDAYN